MLNEEIERKKKENDDLRKTNKDLTDKLDKMSN